MIGRPRGTITAIWQRRPRLSLKQPKAPPNSPDDTPPTTPRREGEHGTCTTPTTPTRRGATQSRPSPMMSLKLETTAEERSKSPPPQRKSAIDHSVMSQPIRHTSVARGMRRESCTASTSNSSTRLGVTSRRRQTLVDTDQRLSGLLDESVGSTALDNQAHAHQAHNSLWRDQIEEHNCAHCGRLQHKLNLCGNCRQVAYCSKECQLAHWPTHKHMCKWVNRAHFCASMRDQVQWYVDAMEGDKEEYMQHLVDAFKVRCDEEYTYGNNEAHGEAIVNKFTRYLYAARGAHLLPSSFDKYDYSQARSDAVNKYRLGDSNNSNDHSVNQLRQQTDQLKQLHSVICGPIQPQGYHSFNFI